MGKIIASPLSKNERLSFGTADDLLGRKPFGERMLGLIQSASNGGVFALDARWGEGKTTFIKMWQHMLEDDGYTCVYLDAFEQDHVSDPFLPLVASIIELGENQKATQQAVAPTLVKVKKNAARLGVKFLGWTTKTAIRVVMQGALDNINFGALTDVKGAIADGSEAGAEAFVEDQMSRFVSDKQTLTNFRKDLESLAGEIVKEDKGPLVFIIDELDRCRPTFAVSLIERIKHVLDVPGIVFVFVLNRKQLEEAVRSVYGGGIDAAEYLGKFIHAWFLLPKGLNQGHDSIYKKYCSALYTAHDMSTWDDARILRPALSEVSRKFALTLREMERMFTNIAIFYSMAKSNSLRVPELTAFLAALRIRNLHVYQKLRTGEMTYAEFDKSVSEFRLLPDDETPISQVHDWLKIALLPDADWQDMPRESPLRKTFGNLTARFHFFERTRLIPFICDQFDMFHAD